MSDGMGVSPRKPLALAAGGTECLQIQIFEAALELQRLIQRLSRLRSGIGLPAYHAEMAEDELPPDLATHLDGILNCVETDLLNDAAETLLAAARTTEDDLRAAYLRQRSQRRAGRQPGEGARAEQRLRQRLAEATG